MKKRIPRRLWRRFTRTKLYNYLPDKMAISIKYKNNFLKKLDLKNPITFNEKLQWLKLYDRKPEYTMMVDKYRVKNYVEKLIGEEYIIPTLGVWSDFDDIDFSQLPEQFVLKCNHGSGDAIICKNKESFDVSESKEKINRALKENYYLISREWPYKDVSRLIIAEEYIEDCKTHEARDYKFFCFDGKVKCFKVDFGRFEEHHANWYDVNGNLLSYGEIVCPPCFEATIDLPEDLSKMIEIAEILSPNYPFLRVDLYYVNGKIYFGELTFYPASGLLRFTDDEWDKQMGEWLKLPISNIRKGNG